MKKYVTAVACCLGLMFSGSGSAKQLSVPVQIDYNLIKKALVTQLYTGAGNSAELWRDRSGCGFLKVANPDIGGQNGQIRMLNNVQAKVGTNMGGQCLTILEWAGTLETFQQPTLDAAGSVLTLPVTRINAYDHDGRYLAIAQLQDLIKRFAEPRLAAVKIDLKESRSDIEQTLAKFLPQENAAQVQDMLSSLRFSSVNAQDNGVDIKLSLDAPEQLVQAQPAPAFTEAEQQQWQAAWPQWDAFLSSAIKQASDDTQSPELRDALMEILMDSRAAFQAGLKDHDANGADPVRVFFTDTWQRLSPVLSTIAKELPGMQGLRYLTFIAATDVIYELDNLGAPFGLNISSDGLRRLARILMAGSQQQTESRSLP